jgi:hypothetical protein
MKFRSEQIVFFKTRKGTSADDLRALLKEGEALVKDGYLLWMEKINLLGDSSFVIELAGETYLASFYLYGEKPEIEPKYEGIEGMDEYQEKLSHFFESREPDYQCEASNSFWQKLQKS